MGVGEPASRPVFLECPLRRRHLARQMVGGGWPVGHVHGAIGAHLLVIQLTVLIDNFVDELIRFVWITCIISSQIG